MHGVARASNGRHALATTCVAQEEKAMTPKSPIIPYAVALTLAMAAGAAQACDPEPDPMWENYECYHGPNLVDCAPGHGGGPPAPGTAPRHGSRAADAQVGTSTAQATDGTRITR
jgi:hypothetical protein